MNREILNQARDLEARISEVKYFLRVFKESVNIRRGNGSRDIEGWITVKRSKKVSIFGSRWFGLGSHTTEIDIPFDLVEVLEQAFDEKLQYLETKFENLGKDVASKITPESTQALLGNQDTNE